MHTFSLFITHVSLCADQLSSQCQLKIFWLWLPVGCAHGQSGETLGWNCWRRCLQSCLSNFHLAMICLVFWTAPRVGYQAERQAQAVSGSHAGWTGAAFWWWSLLDRTHLKIGHCGGLELLACIASNLRGWREKYSSGISPLLNTCFDWFRPVPVPLFVPRVIPLPPSTWRSGIGTGTRVCLQAVWL